MTDDISSIVISPFISENSRSDDEEKDENFWNQGFERINEQDEQWENKELHVILDVPSPSHALSLAIVNDVINKK